MSRAGRPDEAIAASRCAIALWPDHAPAHGNLGAALYEVGQLDEAIAAMERAIALDPALPGVHGNLGNVLRDKGRHDEAIAAHRREIALRPEDAAAHANLGVALHAANQPDLAIAALGRAIALEPHFASAHNNLASVLKDQGHLDLALDSLRKALEIKPDLAEAASNLLFLLHHHPDHDARSLLAAHRQWAARFALPLAAEIGPHANDRTPERRLRVGFVSPDFRGHPVGRLLLPLFANSDRRQVEMVAYSDVRAPDALTAQLETLASAWHPIVGLSDPQVAEKIRADRIDILVDLALHTAHNRMRVFARKPAPVQVTMLGMPTTTGLDTIDYRLTDPYLDPPEKSDRDYAERSVRLPYCFWCYSPPEAAPEVAPLPALKNGFITFGCLNQLAKVTHPALQLWAHILQSLPGARLLLYAPPGSHRQAIRALFGDAGIASERIEFAARMTFEEYLTRYQDLDLCLDPFPFNGATTSLDALWMGVPVVTLAGRTAVGRGGVSILSNAGLTELIALTPEQYVAIALELAKDLATLAELRAQLRQQMQASPLTDGKRYATDVDAAFRRMWQTWCSS